MNKKIISICGCGWLGFPLGIHLLNSGHIVKGSTRSAQKLAAFHQEGIRPFILEVNKKIKGANIPSFFDCDILIIALPPTRKRRDIARFYPVQIAALIEKIIFYGIKKVLFTSSTSVYGHPNRIVTEADDPRPTTAAGIALVAAEKLLREKKAFEITILRLGGLVGLNRPAGRFLAGKSGVKNGLAPVNLVHQEDTIPIIKAVIEQEKWGELFNVCADKHPTKKEFYTHQAQKQGFSPPTFAEETEFVFKEVANYKLKKALGYRFRHPDPMNFD